MTMNVQQFGDSIKAKYPQYQNVDSTTLGSKFLEKYPQYKSQIDTSKIPGIVKGAALTGAGIAGGIGGGALGAIGGALIPGADLTGIPEAAGGYAGAVGGSAAASGGMQALLNIIENAMGNKTDIGHDVGQQALLGGGSEALGIPAAKALGALTHPIATVMGPVDRILANSGKQIDFGALQDVFKGQNIPEFQARGVGQEASDAFKRLQVKLLDMIGARQPQVAAENARPANAVAASIGDEGGATTMTGQGANAFTRDAAGNLTQTNPASELSLAPTPYSGAGPTNILNNPTLPISQANDIKRLLPKLGDLLASHPSETVADTYGRVAQPGLEVPKQFTQLLANTISKEEPSINKYNQLAHMLYTIPDLIQGAESFLPRQARYALNRVGGLPFKAAQATFPQGGGYLNWLLPGLFQGAGESVQ